MLAHLEITMEQGGRRIAGFALTATKNAGTIPPATAPASSDTPTFSPVATVGGESEDARSRSDDPGWAIPRQRAIGESGGAS